MEVVSGVIGLLALVHALTASAPCVQEGCPNVTVYLGPRWGSKVIYTDGLMDGGSHNQEAPVKEVFQDEVNSLPNVTPPPITHLPTRTTRPTNSAITAKGSGHLELTGANLKPIDKSPDTDVIIETPLSEILKMPHSEEGLEEGLEGLKGPKPTYVYDIDSQSGESFEESLRHRLDYLRKPIPDDGSLTIDFSEPEELTKFRVPPILVDDDGTLRCTGYNLTGEEVRETLAMLTPGDRHRLRRLDLSANLIRDLPPLTFPVELEDGLKELVLDNNALQYLSSTSRFELSRLVGLEVLSLRHTALRALPPLLLPSLTALDLQGNQLVEVPDTLSSIPSLTALDLSFNMISAVEEALDLPNLRKLMLNNNSIFFINKNVFGFNFDLEQVHLQNNRLRSVPMEMFESTAVFFLSGNPVDQDTYSLNEERKAAKQSGPLRCASCPGLPTWVFSLTLNASIVIISLLSVLLAVLAIRSRITRLPPYRILEEKLPM